MKRESRKSYYIIKLYEENYEEVIYSESESDDASFEDESSSPSGWIS